MLLKIQYFYVIFELKKVEFKDSINLHLLEDDRVGRSGNKKNDFINNLIKLTFLKK